MDAHVGHHVESIGVYQAGDIIFGKHYAAAMEHDREGATVADIRRLNLLEDDLGELPNIVTADSELEIERQTG